MRILVADDEPTVRSALCLLLAQEAGLDVVGEVSDGPGLIDAASVVQPDVLFVDYELSGIGSPAELFGRLRRTCPGLLVVALSGRVRAREQALASGADAFVSKSDSPERMLSLVRRISRLARGARSGAKPGAPAVAPQPAE